MEIRINENITIICDLETSWLCGNAYHNVRVYERGKKICEQHVHCCDDGYEAIFYVLNNKDIMWRESFRQEALDIVNNHYLCYGEC